MGKSKFTTLLRLYKMRKNLKSKKKKKILPVFDDFGVLQIPENICS